MINYARLQATAKASLTNAGAVTVTVLLLSGTALPTIGVFVDGTAKNIDNRQNPTWVTGETERTVLVPGIDFVNPNTGLATAPQVGGTVQWFIGMTKYKKIINSVTALMPVPNTPILFTLGIE